MEKYIRNVMHKEDSHTTKVSAVVLSNGTRFESCSSLNVYYHVPRGEGDRHYVDIVESTRCRRFYNFESIEFYNISHVYSYILNLVIEEMKSQGDIVSDELSERIKIELSELLPKSPDETIDIRSITEKVLCAIERDDK